MNGNNLFYLPKYNGNAKFKLFCFPFAGGNFSSYMPWIRSVDKEVELILAQLPGRGARILDQPYLSMSALVSDLLADIIPLIDRPYILFGHSLGAKVAYELMLALKKMGFPLPVHFIASASPAPYIPRKSPPIHHLADSEFIQALSNYNGTSAEILNDHELMAMLLPSLRADFTILENYLGNKNEPVHTNLSLFGGEQDKEVNLNELLAWKSLFEFNADHRLFPGGHFFLQESSGLLVNEINKILQHELMSMYGATC